MDKSGDIEKEPLLMRKSIYYTSGMENGFENGVADKHAALHVERPVYQLDDLNQATMYQKPPTSLKKSIHKAISCSPFSFLLTTVPVLKWLPKYNCKKYFMGDLISGITIAIMHIPQGMAYGLLGNLPPVIGIYMAFFPVLTYFFFGTSRHVSIGTFAIVCLMTGKTVSRLSSQEFLSNGTLATIPSSNGNETMYTSIEVATAVTFTVALIQMFLYVCRLGIVTTLLSETLVNGFTCASAFHVVASQLKDLFGIATVKRTGNFRFIFTVYDAIQALPNANRMAVGLSVVFSVIMILNNEIFKVWLAKKTKIPVPIELVAVVVGTICSYFFNLKGIYGIRNVGNIPTGLPEFTLPTFSLIQEVAVDSFVITIVSYSITMSMALIFAHKMHYEVDANQELFAMSMSNFVGSFFSCMPITASLSRSVLQHAMGGFTQIASIISCAILLVVLLWIGPLFESLPRCVLASIIVVALKSMLLQCTEFKRYFALSKWDGFVWLTTFCCTLFIEIDIGLLAGIVVSLLSIYIQGYSPHSCLLGVVPNTDLYLDMKRYKGVSEISGIKIFHYAGCLNFSSKASFRNLLVKRTGFDPSKVLAKMEDNRDEFEKLVTRCVILDFSCVSFVDPSGAQFLRSLGSEYEELGVNLYITGCSGPVFEILKKCDRYHREEGKFIIFPTIHDAVLYEQSSWFKRK